MADPSITLFSGDPTEPGTVGKGEKVICWGQATLYPQVVSFGAGGPGDFIVWAIQLSPTDDLTPPADYFDQQVVEPAPGTGLDTDPSPYVIRYDFGGGIGKKPSIMLPLNSSFVRVRTQRSPGAVGADLLVRVEFSGFGQVQQLGG